MHVVRIIRITALAPEIFELTVSREPAFHFVPGDCVALFNDAGDSRPYSIASGTDEPELRFLIRRMPSGAVSDWLARAAPGDALRLSPPFGWFRPRREDDAPCIYIATGTGVAPFLSALRSAPPHRPAACLYGVRHLADAVALDTLQAQAPVRLAVSREPVTPPHYHGRVTGLLDTLPLTQDTQFYLCGLDTMIDETTAWLIRRGVPLAHIHREIFFNA